VTGRLQKVKHNDRSSTKLYDAVHKRLISLTDRVAVRRENGASRPRHVLQIAVFRSSKPARGAGVPHGDRPGAQLSPQTRQCNSMVFCSLMHITNRLFAGKQSAYLADRCHIYLLPNGRINVGSLNRNNLDRFAQALHEAVINVPDQETKAQLNTNQIC